MSFLISSDQISSGFSTIYILLKIYQILNTLQLQINYLAHKHVNRLPVHALFIHWMSVYNIYFFSSLTKAFLMGKHFICRKGMGTSRASSVQTTLHIEKDITLSILWIAQEMQQQTFIQQTFDSKESGLSSILELHKVPILIDRIPHLVMYWEDSHCIVFLSWKILSLVFATG